MRLRTIIFSALFICCLVACSSSRTKSRVWQAPDHTITAETSFDVRPVTDATEKGVKPEVLLLLALSLEEQFARKKLPIFDPARDEAPGLSVQSEVQAYKINVAPSAKRWQKDLYGLCVLRTRLLDNNSNEVVAEIYTINQTYFGRGLLEPKNPEIVLSESAATVAKEVAKLITD